MALRKHDGGDEAVHSGAVLDRDRPTPAGAQLFREQACGDIGAGAEAERQDEIDGSLRPVSLGCGAGERAGDDGTQCLQHAHGDTPTPLAPAGMQHIKLATVSHRRAGNCATFTSRTLAAMAPFVLVDDLVGAAGSVGSISRPNARRGSFSSSCWPALLVGLLAH